MKFIPSSEYENSLYFSFQFHPEQYLGGTYVSGKLLIIFCESGEADMIISGENIHVDKHTMLLLHPHAELEMTHYTEDYQGQCLGYMMAIDESRISHIDPAFFAYILRKPNWMLDTETLRAAKGFCDTYDYICNQMECSSKGDMISSLMSVFIQLLYEKTKHLFEVSRTDSSLTKRTLLQRFLHQLNLHYKEDHRVTYYADLLCVSPKYLTQVVKQSITITPKDMIDRKLASESLFLLSKTNMTIQEISIHLGFPDQSYFGRFFRRIFQMSPLQFRQNPNLDLMKRLMLPRIK